MFQVGYRCGDEIDGIVQLLHDVSDDVRDDDGAYHVFFFRYFQPQAEINQPDLQKLNAAYAVAKQAGRAFQLSMELDQYSADAPDGVGAGTKEGSSDYDELDEYITLKKKDGQQVEVRPSISVFSQWTAARKLELDITLQMVTKEGQDVLMEQLSGTVEAGNFNVVAETKNQCPEQHSTANWVVPQ